VRVFSVKLMKRGLLADDVRLTDYGLSFESAPLTGRFTQQEFYQDPQDPTQKKVGGDACLYSSDRQGRF
jgi:hypothetical protein